MQIFIKRQNAILIIMTQNNEYRMKEILRNTDLDESIENVNAIITYLKKVIPKSEEYSIMDLRTRDSDQGIMLDFKTITFKTPTTYKIQKFSIPLIAIKRVDTPSLKRYMGNYMKIVDDLEYIETRKQEINTLLDDINDIKEIIKIENELTGIPSKSLEKYEQEIKDKEEKLEKIRKLCEPFLNRIKPIQEDLNAYPFSTL